MSRRLVPAALTLALAAGACMPGFVPISAADSQATTIALAGTLAAHTLAALPSPTLPATNTPFPTSTPVIAPADTETPTQTASAAASSLPSPTAATGSPAPTPTATASSTASPTASAAASGTTTPTATPGVLIHGTMPPAVPYGFVTLINQTNRMVYIAFRCTFGDNQTTLAEYPVYGRHKITLPAGYCEWRAWVRGQEFTGSIHIKRFEEYTFTFKRNRVIVAP